MDHITAHRAKTGQQQQQHQQQQQQQWQGTSRLPPQETAAERRGCPQRGGGVQIGIGSPASQHSSKSSCHSHNHVVPSPGSDYSHRQQPPSDHSTMDMDIGSGLSISELNQHDARHAYDPMFPQQEAACDIFQFPHFPDPLPTPNTFADQLSPRAGSMLDSSSLLSYHEMEVDPNLVGDYRYSPCYCRSTSGSIGLGDAAGSGMKTTQSSALPSKTSWPSSMEDRFEMISESVRQAGFKSMDDMILSYYTTTLEEDSDMCHEQRMSRKRGLPAVLSALRTSAATWDEYERQGYQAEVLESAESLLVHECQELFSSPAFKHRLLHLHSPLTPHTPSSTSSLDGDGGFENRAPHSSAFLDQSTSHLRIWLSEELPNVWKLISALSGCRAGSQPVATALLTLCLAQRLRADEVALLLQAGST